MRQDKIIVRILLIFSFANIALAAPAVVRRRHMDVAEAASRSGKRGGSDDEATNESGSETMPELEPESDASRSGSEPMPELVSDSDESRQLGSDPYFLAPESPFGSVHEVSPPTPPPPASFREGSKSSGYPAWWPFDEDSNHDSAHQDLVSDSPRYPAWWPFGEDSTKYPDVALASGSSHQDAAPELLDGSSHQDVAPESPDGPSHQDVTPESPDGPSHEDAASESPYGPPRQDVAPESPDGPSHQNAAPKLTDGSSHIDLATESSIGTAPSLGGSVAAQHDATSESPLFDPLHLDSASPESTLFNDPLKKKLKTYGYFGAAAGITAGVIAIIYEIQKATVGSHSHETYVSALFNFLPLLPASDP